MDCPQNGTGVLKGLMVHEPTLNDPKYVLSYSVLKNGGPRVGTSEDGSGRAVGMLRVCLNPHIEKGEGFSRRGERGDTCDMRLIVQNAAERLNPFRTAVPGTILGTNHSSFK